MDTLRISSVITTDSRMRSMHISIPIVIKTVTGNKTVETKVLLDTGAEGLFMDKNYAEEHDIVLQQLMNPITPSNVDGTLNHAGEITHFTWIQAKIDKRILLEKLWITDLGSSDVIFGFPWFKENNPQIVWKTGRVQLPKAVLETTFLYLAKDGQRRREIKEEEDEFRKELLQQSSPKRNRTEHESTLLERKKGRQPNHETRPRTPPTEEKRRPGQFSKTNTPQTERTTRFNEIETRTETEPISPDWRQQRQNKGKSPMMGNPSKRRTEQIAKQSDEPNWRSRKWEKPIQEVESPSIAPKTEMSIKLEHDDEQSQRSRLKEIIRQRIASQSIPLPTEKTIEEIAEDDENERNLRTRLKKGIIQRTEPLSTAQTPFIEEMESDEEDEESETEEDYKRRREFIHAYLTMDNENEQVKQEETETDEGIIGTPEEQKRRLIQAYLTPTMEEEETTEEQSERRKLIHAYSKRTMDNDKEQSEQDEIDMYLRTSTEEELKSSTWEEYDEGEPLEENEEDKSFKENDDEGKWTTQFSYPTEEEENALFIAFMTGNVEDQKTWINAKMNLARATTNEETRRREEEILNRIIPTGIVDLDEAFEEEDEEETDDLSECQPYDLDMDQEEDFILKDTKIYPFSLPGQEKPDEFIDKDQEEEDIQSSKPLKASYRDHERQNEDTPQPLSELDDLNQLDKARYFTELDVRWKYDNRHTEDEDQWKMNFKANQKLFEPTVIFSRPYSSTASQAKTDEIFLNQKNECRIDIDDNSETKEQNTEYTRCVSRRSRDNDLFAELEGCASWATRTEYEGMLNPENQPQTESRKGVGIDEWPTQTTTKRVKSFLGFENFNTEFTLNDEDLIKPHNKQDENEQDNRDMVKLPKGSSPDLLDHEFDDERAFEIDDEQLDPIKTLSAREPETLHKHFSKVAAATSVNNVITVGDMNMDLQKWLTMAQDMNMIVNHTINILLGRRPYIWKDTLKDWLSRTPQLPNGNTAVTTRNILCHYTKEDTTNQSIEEEDDQKTLVLNIFCTPMILLPRNPQVKDTLREDSLSYDERYPESRIINLLRSIAFNFGMVVEDHQSSRGVILGFTTQQKDKRYGPLDKATFDRQRQITSLGFLEIKQPLENQSTMSAAHHPMTNGTIKQTRHRTWKLFPTFEFSLNKKITPERKKSFKIDQTSGPVICRLKFPEILGHKFCNYTGYVIKHNVSDHPSQHVSPKDQIHPHFQNLFDSC